MRHADGRQTTSPGRRPRHWQGRRLGGLVSHFYRSWHYINDHYWPLCAQSAGHRFMDLL